ncbi:hypothetical protein FS837_005589 [Tulasnella sp. UAMH 9824]|nr:hypothetical protein FS837_005589 [Tulasnella sp. UAMH 9824]
MSHKLLTDTPAQAVPDFNDDIFAELLSFLNNSSDNPTSQPSKASDSPCTTSPAPALTQPLATPTIGSSPLDGPVYSSSHHPAPDVASSALLSVESNQSPFLFNGRDNAGLVASPAKQQVDPAARSVSPVKNVRHPGRFEASQILCLSRFCFRRQSSPAETAYYPDPHSRMWGRPSPDDERAAESPASSPTKEVLTPNFRTSPPKTLRCPHDGCTSIFARAHDLRRHANIHTGILPFTCLACKKGFNRSDGRKRHWKQDPDCEDVHMGLEERGYDGGGKRRRGKKSQGRKTGKYDLVTRWGSSVALPIAETTTTSAPEPTVVFSNHPSTP